MALVTHLPVFSTGGVKNDQRLFSVFSGVFQNSALIICEVTPNFHITSRGMESSQIFFMICWNEYFFGSRLVTIRRSINHTSWEAVVEIIHKGTLLLHFYQCILEVLCTSQLMWSQSNLQTSEMSMFTVQTVICSSTQYYRGLQPAAQ